MKTLRDETGTALLLAITLLLMLAAVGTAASLTARIESLIAGNLAQGQEALYVAEGALARAIQDLSPVADWTPFLAGVPSTFSDGAATGTKSLPGGETVVLCCGAGSLTDELQQRAGGATWGGNTPQWRLFGWGPASTWLAAGRLASPYYVAVWIADDPEDGDSDPIIDSNGVVLVHALAFGASRSRRAVQTAVRHARRPDGTWLWRGATIVWSRESRW